MSEHMLQEVLTVCVYIKKIDSIDSNGRRNNQGLRLVCGLLVSGWEAPRNN